MLMTGRRLDPRGQVLASDIEVVVTGFGISGKQLAINRWSDVIIAINRAVAEFDLKNVASLAVADRMQRGRVNMLPRNM